MNSYEFSFYHRCWKESLQHLSCVHTALSHVLVVYCHPFSASKHRHVILGDVVIVQREVPHFWREYISKKLENVQSLHDKGTGLRLKARGNVCARLCMCVLACAHVCVYSVSVYTYMHMLRFVHGHAHEADDRAGGPVSLCVEIFK